MLKKKKQENENNLKLMSLRNLKKKQLKKYLEQLQIKINSKNFIKFLIITLIRLLKRFFCLESSSLSYYIKLIKDPDKSSRKYLVYNTDYCRELTIVQTTV